MARKTQWLTNPEGTRRIRVRTGFSMDTVIEHVLIGLDWVERDRRTVTSSTAKQIMDARKAAGYRWDAHDPRPRKRPVV